MDRPGMHVLAATIRCCTSQHLAIHFAGVPFPKASLSDMVKASFPVLADFAI